MATKTYSEKLLDPRWQKKRLQIFERDDFKCQICGNRNNTLQIHHKFYLKNLEPWQYDDKAFVTVCKDCHEKLTFEQEQIKSIIAQLPIPLIDDVKKFLQCINEYDKFDLWAQMSLIKYVNIASFQEVVALVSLMKTRVCDDPTELPF